MNTFMFTQITNTVLGILIVGEIVSLINRKMRLAGIIALVLAIVVLMVGIITPISVVICTIVAIVVGGLGVFAILKDKKEKKSWIG